VMTCSSTDDERNRQVWDLDHDGVHRYAYELDRDGAMALHALTAHTSDPTLYVYAGRQLTQKALSASHRLHPARITDQDVYRLLPLGAVYKVKSR
jgi:hypothetical protein